ncbi:unnamed protein product [Pleuronectes platessa]|uniref:Uncharacterized protein n=1 Tax=Pleuronectes platessa TaxID=8262 RepID=A0A9N7VGT1_PLEPL|nr:unnamed protein product [Pleuronectes platessa]
MATSELLWEQAYPGTRPRLSGVSSRHVCGVFEIGKRRGQRRSPSSAEDERSNLSSRRHHTGTLISPRPASHSSSAAMLLLMCVSVCASETPVLAASEGPESSPGNSVQGKRQLEMPEVTGMTSLCGLGILPYRTSKIAFVTGGRDDWGQDGPEIQKGLRFQIIRLYLLPLYLAAETILDSDIIAAPSPNKDVHFCSPLPSPGHSADTQRNALTAPLRRMDLHIVLGPERPLAPRVILP